MDLISQVVISLSKRASSQHSAGPAPAAPPCLASGTRCLAERAGDRAAYPVGRSKLEGLGVIGCACIMGCAPLGGSRAKRSVTGLGCQAQASSVVQAGQRGGGRVLHHRPCGPAAAAGNCAAASAEPHPGAVKHGIQNGPLTIDFGIVAPLVLGIGTALKLALWLYCKRVEVRPLQSYLSLLTALLPRGSRCSCAERAGGRAGRGPPERRHACPCAPLCSALCRCTCGCV